MVFLGNLLWFVLGGGFFAWLGWIVLGALLALTVIGIPFAQAAWRISRFAAFPFGRTLVDAELTGAERIPGTGLANLLWFLLAGVWLGISHVVAGVGYCVTIIGIPFGLAHFKLAMVSLAPLGKRVVPTGLSSAAWMSSEHRNALEQERNPFRRAA